MDTNGKQVVVREVWAWNLPNELALIYSIHSQYPFASLDTEFPGTIFNYPIEKHLLSKLSPSNNYDLMKMNVDALNIIQIGLTLSDSAGNLPDFGTDFCYIWQFNFMDYDIEHDQCNPESIQLLQQQGIDFWKNKIHGISSWDFRFFLQATGVLSIMPHLTWVTFHCTYDFGFLIKILTAQTLPHNIHDFRFLVAQYFGRKIYDIKHIMKSCNGLYGGLERVAKTLNVDRVAGQNHQAGSDCLLTLQTFIKLRDVYFANNVEGLLKVEGVLYGLDINHHRYMSLPNSTMKPLMIVSAVWPQQIQL